MPVKPEFIVIDTEGKHELSEIAIINSQGQLVYEAFTQGHPSNYDRRFNVKPLPKIILDFLKLANSNVLVFHHANHDLRVLKQSFQKAGINWQNFRVECSCELARYYFPGFPSYSLEYLSKRLTLKVNHQYFNPNQAHTAKYDAQFTHQLYLKIMHQKARTKGLMTLRDKPNPFASTRVDTPFQDHLDLKDISQKEFEILKSVITDIKYDKNHQSKGVIVIGELGTGKTHLMMRLAKELLHINRLLFIRQPNNPDSVLYHTYSRILESFVEKVPGSQKTQLEHLLAHSFVKLISTTKVMTLTNKDREILSATAKNKLNLYESLGTEGTQKKRDYWQHIEKRANDWWISEYGTAGYSAQILKGIIKFCSYSEPRRKELVMRWLSANELTSDELNSIGLTNWNQEMSKEEFSLQAISVFSKLSMLDEPLIIVFDQLEALGLNQYRKILLSFGEAVKELFTHVPNSLIILNLFPDRWEQFRTIFDGSIVDRVSQHKVRLQRPSNDKLKEILELKLKSIGVKIENLFSLAELDVILNQTSIRAVLTSAADHYLLNVKHIPIQTFPASQDELEAEDTIQHRLQTLEDELADLKQQIIRIAEVLNNSIAPEISAIPSAELNKMSRYLQEQRSILEQDYTKPQIISDSDDIGKLTTIAEAFKTINSFELDYLRLGKRKLPEHLVIKHKKQHLTIGFLQADGSSFTSRIKNCNELVLINKTVRFILLRDCRKPKITGKVGKEEIEKFNHTRNGEFLLIEKEDRIRFELIYKLITDIQNKDFDVDLTEALESLTSHLRDYWLIQVFQLDPSSANK